VAHDFDFFVQPDFGYSNTYSDTAGTINSVPGAYAVSLQDAWVDWKYFPDFTIKAGKFKTPFDLENLQDTRYTEFVELGLTGNLSPQRDVGVQVGGNLYYDWITYAAGIFDGAADKETGYGGYNTGGDSNSRSGTGRVFITPFKDTSIEPLQGLGIGYAASYGKEKGSDLPTYVSPGQSPVFAYNTNVSASGPQLRTEPQAYYYYKSLGILGEKVDDYERLQYTVSTHHYTNKVDNKAFNVEASYVLTGEDASYNGVVPRHDFSLSSHTWGAFELVGRYGELKLDKSIFSEGYASLNSSINEENDWATGINWYLNGNVKLAFDFEQTKFRRGAPNGLGTFNRKDEDLFTGLAQLSF
jgi:phosphate-selective porin OprO/OprP